MKGPLMNMKTRIYIVSALVFTALTCCACGDVVEEPASASETTTTIETCSERETWAMPFCDDDSLPEAGDGCYQSCNQGEPECQEGACTHAWVGCGPNDDCGVCGTDSWICM